MKPVARRGLGLLLVIVCLVIWALGASLSRKALRVRTCTGKETLEVIVTDSLERRFVEKEDVEKWLDDEYGAYAGLRLDSVNLEKIESIVLGHSAVKSCEAWLTDDGTLHIELSQREPVVRFNDTGNGWYCDAGGYIFPLQSRFSVDVPVVDGKFPLSVPRGYKGPAGSDAEKKWLEQLLSLVSYMNSSIWKDNISRISVLRSGDLVLRPAEGKETFIFGSPTRVKEKFALLEKYYTTVVPCREAGYYSEVDLRYSGQLICRK